MPKDPAFLSNQQGLAAALTLLLKQPGSVRQLPQTLPETGISECRVLEDLAPLVLGKAQNLGADISFAHMDPPTPWITWATSMWTASLNQNLLHPDVSPSSREIEKLVISWLSPAFGMSGGHMTPGSTVSNLTALWAARETRKISTVVASDAAHLSIGKAAHILGLDYVSVPTCKSGKLNIAALPSDMSRSALVLTAGTTSAGAIDEHNSASSAAWTHVDAAWAGPLVFSKRHADKLACLRLADSVSVSAHKWLFQPKESGLLFFRDVDAAHSAVSFGGAYLSVPNVGLLGSHGANAVPLLATLLSWGKEGISQRIDHAMSLADDLRNRLLCLDNIEVFGPNISGVILWRDRREDGVDDILKRLPTGMCSTTEIHGKTWIRNVAANPNANIDALLRSAVAAMKSHY